MKNTIWQVGNDVLFAEQIDVIQYCKANGLVFDTEHTDFPARGVITNGKLVLTSGSAIRMMVGQLQDGGRGVGVPVRLGTRSASLWKTLA